MKFENRPRSYLCVAALGLGAGLLTQLLNLFPYDTLWSLSSIASAFGFWMVTTTLVIDRSSSNANAAANTFLYLSCMNLMFYGSQAVMGLFLPAFHNAEGFLQWRLLLTYDVIALVCAAAAYVLYFWTRGGRLGDVLHALPLCGLGAETIGVIVFLYRTHTYLFQTLFDVCGLALLAALFWKRVHSKPLFLTVAVLGAVAGAWLVYL